MTLTQLHIHEDAMEKDITRLRNAKNDLDSAKNYISKLKAYAETMHGKTGQAISDKADILQADVSRLESNLDATVSAIQRARSEYEEKEQDIIITIGNI